MFRNFFKKTNNLDRISKSVNDHKVKVDSIIKEIKFGRSFKENYVGVLLELCEYLKIYIWKKDKDFLYEFSNKFHCEDFLCWDFEHIHKIIGLSDQEIFKTQKSKTNTLFNEICILTDALVKEEKKECDFVEGDFRKNVLIVKKIPNIINNKFLGTTGIAQEYGDKNILSIYLDRMLKRNSARLIYGSLDKGFCCQIYNSSIQKNLFTFMVDRRKNGLFKGI